MFGYLCNIGNSGPVDPVDNNSDIDDSIVFGEYVNTEYRMNTEYRTIN